MSGEERAWAMIVCTFIITVTATITTTVVNDRIHESHDRDVCIKAGHSWGRTDGSGYRYCK